MKIIQSLSLWAFPLHKSCMIYETNTSETMQHEQLKVPLRYSLQCLHSVRWKGSAFGGRIDVFRTVCAVMQVYKKTYSWAHNSNDANWAAYITIARAPEHRHSEEDMERGVCDASVSGRPVRLCANALPAIRSH